MDTNNGEGEGRVKGILGKKRVDWQGTAINALNQCHYGMTNGDGCGGRRTGGRGKCHNRMYHHGLRCNLGNWHDTCNLNLAYDAFGKRRITYV
jgi:hypothetical protein